MKKRFTLSALLAAVVLLGTAGGAFAGTGAGTTAASQPGAPYQTSDGWCHFTNWGGNWYCLGTGIDAVIWQKPDGYPQVFVLGTDRSLFSRWSTASGTSSWLDMGGTCNPSYGLPSRSSGWSITVACVGTDNAYWHRTRRTDGTWTAWAKGRGF